MAFLDETGLINLWNKIDNMFLSIKKGALYKCLTSKLTANRALISNGKGNIDVSAVTATELGYLDGAKSNIQNQLDQLNGNSTKPLTMRSGYSVFQSINHLDKCGRTVHMMLGVYLSSGMTMWGPNTVADIPSGYRPQYYPTSYAISRNGVWCIIDCAGSTVKVQPMAASVMQNDTLIIDTSWVC